VVPDWIISKNELAVDGTSPSDKGDEAVASRNPWMSSEGPQSDIHHPRVVVKYARSKITWESCDRYDNRDGRKILEVTRCILRRPKVSILFTDNHIDAT
jgi:uncharacterized Zn-finger protein